MVIQPKSSGSELTRKFSRHDNAAYVTFVSQLIYTTILERRIGRDLSIIHTERLTVVGRGEMKFYASFGSKEKIYACLLTELYLHPVLMTVSQVAGCGSCAGI